jgi:hypothetical protein
MTSLARLQSWYLKHCDGDWEHQFGVEITTLDNPGWMVKIELNGTCLEEREFQLVRISRSENDWLFISRTATEIKIGCGPENLEEGLAIFCDWAESCPDCSKRSVSTER